MSGLGRRLDDLWFAPAPPARPALLRIAVGGFALVYLYRRRRMLANVAATDPRLFAPVGLAHLHRAPLPVPTVRMLVDVTLLANVAFILGWKHRYTGPTFSGLLLWLLSYRNSWSMIYHMDNVLVFHALILGTTRSADALSLDALARRPASRPAGLLGLGGGTPAADWRYGWPIQLMNAVTVATYFVSGVAKLKGASGRSWATGESLRSQVAVDGLRKELLGDGASPLAYALYDRVALFGALATGSLLLELGAPLVLVDRRLGQVWAVNAFLMHWGIYAVMTIKFRYQMTGVIYASFFELERALAHLAGAAHRR